MQPKKKVTVNKEQRLYVIPCGNDGYSCYGFDVVKRRTKALAEEMAVPYKEFRTGSLRAYNEMGRIVRKAIAKGKGKTEWRSETELYKPFIGNEGRRVEVTNTDGTKERFIIGKSYGTIPSHIMLKRSDSVGGGAVLESLIKSFIFLD